MRIEYNERTDTYTVKVTNDDLIKAFSSHSNLATFLHEIAKDTLGESFANEYFPLWDD